MNTVTFSIPNINCGHCVNTIQNEVSELDGVQEVRADAASKTAVITFDSPASEASLRALLTEINYPAAD